MHQTFSIGEFSLPSNTWSNPLLSSSVSNPTYVFVDFVQRNAILYHRPNSNDRDDETCINLFITNEIFSISDRSIANNFSTSDQLVVSFKINTSITTNSISTSRYDFTKADWSAINNHLFCIDWQTAFAECADVPAQFDLWSDKLTDIIRIFMLTKTHCNNSAGGVNKYSLHIRKLLSKKRSTWRIYKLLKSTAAQVRYKTIAARYRKALYTLKCNRKLALVNSGNTGAFYRYANSKLKSKVSMAPLITVWGDVTSDPIVKAELLKEYFSLLFKLSTATSYIINRPSFYNCKTKTRTRKVTQSQPAVRTVSLLYFLKAVNTLYPNL